MSILVVLTIIMLAMAASYATLHRQSTMLSIAENGQSQVDARQVAQAAMSLALRRMHVASEWGGADTSFAGSFNSTQRYTVAYYTGITNSIGTPQLPDASDVTATREWPYCVTVVATGYAKSDSNGTNESSHCVRSVVRLANPQLQNTPNNWAIVPYCSLIQWANSDLEFQLPARIEGLAYTQGGWNFADEYPEDHELKAFHGKIDEVAIYNSALSQSQIQSIGSLVYSYDYGNYNGLPFIIRLLHPSLPSPVARWKLNESDNSTTAADSAGSNDGVYYGAKPTSYGTPSPGNRCADFDGYNDIVNLGKMNLSGSQMTILAWFRADDFDTDDARIISKATTDSNSDHWWMISTIKVGGDYRLRFRLKAGGSTQELIASSGNLYPNTWTFVAATYDGSNMRLYKDGNQVGSTSKSGSINTNSNAWVFLGGNPPGSAKVRYLRDLREMELAGAGSVMPVQGYLYTPESRTSGEELSLIKEDLQIPLINVGTENPSNFLQHPGSVNSYQLYPGGKNYNTSSLGSSLTSTSKTPDIQTNPLGIFTRGGSLVLYNNVSIQGTVITTGSGSSGDIEISGTNVNFTPCQIPRLDGTGTTFQLPVVLANDDFKIAHSGGMSAQGIIYAGDDFRTDDGNETVTLDVQGKVITKELYLNQRWQWNNKGGIWWRDRLTAFLAQLSTPGAANYSPYFPQWLKNTQSLDPVPKIKIAPDPTNPTYHWHTFSQPLFTYDANSDTGMHWDIIAWEDGA